MPVTNIFIIGYPRTATTGIYQAVCRELGEAAGGGEGPLCIYEPFNPEVVDDIYERGLHEHDRVGEIIHTYDLLPRQLFEEIRLNAHWLDGFMRGGTPYLGGKWLYILNSLVEYARRAGRPLVVKDVYAWPRLGEIARLFWRDALVVMPYREPHYVFRSLQWWLDSRRRVRLVRRVGLSKLRPVKIMRYIRYYMQSKRVMRADNMFGLAFFYKYFYGHTLDNNMDPGELLRLYFYTTYHIYYSITSSLAHNRRWNTLRIVFGDRLSEKAMEQAVISIFKKALGADWFSLLGRDASRSNPSFKGSGYLI